MLIYYGLRNHPSPCSDKWTCGNSQSNSAPPQCLVLTVIWLWWFHKAVCFGPTHSSRWQMLEGHLTILIDHLYPMMQHFVPAGGVYSKKERNAAVHGAHVHNGWWSRRMKLSIFRGPPKHQTSISDSILLVSKDGVCREIVPDSSRTVPERPGVLLRLNRYSVPCVSMVMGTHISGRP